MVKMIQEYLHRLYYKYYWWGEKIDHVDLPFAVMGVWMGIPLIIMGLSILLEPIYGVHYTEKMYLPGIIVALIYNFIFDWYFDKRFQSIINSKKYDTKKGTILAILSPIVIWIIFIFYMFFVKYLKTNECL